MRMISGQRVVKSEKTAALKTAEKAVHTAFQGKSTLEALGRDPATDPGMAAWCTAVQARQPYRGFEYSLSLPDGGTVWMESNGNPVFAESGEFTDYRGTSRNVTRRKEDEAMITFLARHDALTGLPNRILFRERIASAIDACGQGNGIAVFCLDPDRFKGVNDTLGHSVGDALLRTAADRLRECIRGVDTVARLGGDEFVVVQTGVEKPEEVSALARRISRALSMASILEGHHVSIGTTIGIALYPQDGTTPEELLRHADIALYRAKLSDPGSWCFFEQQMGQQVESRRELESGLRLALARQEFDLFYQPLYNVESRQVIAVEALIRWRHPQKGLIPPDDFIPIAEETGLIVPIGEWVIRTACAAAATWPQHVSVAVNISPAQFKSRNLTSVTREALKAAGLPGSRLEIEITEAVLMLNSDATLRVLHELRALGARISMDDFGTGYSSLSYLRSFPFDKIKIDRSFSRDLTGTSGAAAIVRAISGLGNSLHLTTTAEGVETDEQFAILAAEGCTEVQGFLFSRPVPVEELMPLLQASADAKCGPDAAQKDLLSRFSWVTASMVPEGMAPEGVAPQMSHQNQYGFCKCHMPKCRTYFQVTL